MDLLRKALREVEARVKPFTAASTSRSDPNDLAGTRLVVAGRTFRVGAMFAEGGAARVYRCASVSDGPGKRDDGRDGTVDAAEASAPLALKQCLLPPELSDAEARREGVVHASVSAHDDVVTLHAHDVLVPPETRGEEKRNARGESARGRARAALLVMDLCEESLAERARRLGGLGEADALRACACAARAVAHMHACDPPVAHFDVKPENVLSVLSSPPAGKKNENGDAASARSTWRLCDFGSAHVGGDRVFSTPRDRSRAESQFARTTTPTYRAPEMWDVRHPVFAARGVGRPADVWALGCLLFQLLEDRPPFGADAKLAALSGRFAWSPEVVSRTSEKTRALVKHALATDPSSRPSAAEVAARCEALAADAEAGPVAREVSLEAPLGNVPEPPDVPEPSEPETGWASFDAEPSAPTSAAAFGKPADEDARADENAAEAESSLGETTTGWATFS
jgi:AP2-associated kinase